MSAERGQDWQDMSRLDFDGRLARRIRRGWMPDRLAEIAAQRQAQVDAQLPGQDELDLFGGAE